MERLVCECGVSCPVAGYPAVCACGKLHERPSKAAKRYNRSRGFGDTVAKFTKAIGISPCCGCEERRELLNEMFPYSPEYTAEQERIMTDAGAKK